MLATRLLSLNIHEALSLDGAELCLHPDLFVNEGGGSQPTRKVSSLGVDDTTNKGGVGGASLASGATGPSSRLSVGDMIEIRVWDPLPKDSLESPSLQGSSTLRKTVRQTSAIASSSINSTTTGVQGEASTANTSQSTAVNPLRPRTSLPANTLQYSESDASDTTSVNNDASTAASSHEKDRSVDQDHIETGSIVSMDDDQHSAPPTKTVIAPAAIPQSSSIIGPSQLPPVFPRQPSTTAETNKLPKPPPIQRRVSSLNSTLSSSHRSPKPTSRHYRDLSDMTVESHQLDFRDIRTMGSDEDDTMDDPSSKLGKSHKLRLSFVLLVTEKTLTTLKGNTRTQISMLRQVADLYSLSSYDMVTVHKIEPQDESEVLKIVSADFVVVTIKDQFISRGDMHFFQTGLIGSWIYEGQRLSEATRGIKAHAREIRHGDRLAKSGIITDKTVITFRSRSARIVWLVQLSSEMWDYTSPYEHADNPESVCEIYFDQWIRFIYKLFAKWKELEATHSLTVIFFSRTFLSSGQKSSLNCRDVHGRSYEDHCKPVIENETCSDWESLVVRIKEEFLKYPLEVGWNLKDRRPSNANQGNVLEAINVVLNVMQFHYLDRDLRRTGNSLVVISPGCGVFEVDKGLASITYQRMMDNGIGSDMLSLGLPPLHIAPFFLYNIENRNLETEGVDTSETYYEVPHWMHLSFVNYDREDNRPKEQGASSKAQNIRNSWTDSYEIAAHGFLRPKVDQNLNEEKDASSPQLKASSPPTSFSAVGNAAATPGKTKSIRERQLISGRDFRDILEATKPRPSGMGMPSALTSLLKLQQMLTHPEKTRLTETELKSRKSSDSKNMRLREWGAVDFSEYTLQPKSNSSVRKLSPELVNERFEGENGGSISSSFASNVSSLFSMSYDRVLWDQFEPPGTSRKIIQIQRSPSLEFDRPHDNLPLDSDTAFSGDSMSLGNETGSRSSLGPNSIGTVDGSSIGAETSSHTSKREKHVERLRRMMEAHDMRSCAPLIPQVERATEMNLVRRDSNYLGDSDVTTTKSGLLSANRRHSLKAKGISQPGGLEAALSQYSSAIDGRKGSEMQAASMMVRRLSGNLFSGQVLPVSSKQHERVLSSSPLFPNVKQFHERSTIGMSPLLLPPVSQVQTSDSSDKLRQAETTPVIMNRTKALDNKGFQPRETSLPGGIFSGKNHEYGSSRQKISSVSRSPPTLDGNRQKIGPISRSPPTLDWTRQKIMPISRSPPTLDGNRQKIAPISKSPPTVSIVRQSMKGVSSSPPISGGIVRERSGQRQGSRDIPPTSQKQSMGSRRKKVFNPFRQSDEDEVLATRSHNRRRWSHVFPAGEVEFKRHSGPIWNSLTSPAILPLSIDYFPSPQELRDESKFQFSPYTVTLGGLDKKHYSTHSELLMEMVRQRTTQDFQIVTVAALRESENRAESQRQGRNTGKSHSRIGNSRGRDSFVPSLPTIKPDTSGTIKHHLSMGHRIQVMKYDPSSDTIEIVLYNAKSAHNDPMNVYNYRFLLFSKATQKYVQSIQTFKKYSEPYKWNKVDNLICGEDNRSMEEGMRFRRVMFGLIPESFEDGDAEQEYISKFKRLLEYLEKLKDKEDSTSNLDVEIISNPAEKGASGNEMLNVRRDTSDSMIRFTVQLRKGKRDSFEWIEIAIDSKFDTASSYRIIFNWLVASSTNVEAQVQLLHRRCTQFGLHLIGFPQTTISRNLFLHALAAPNLICIRDKQKASLLEDELKKIDFVDDGIHFTDPQMLECIENSQAFQFPKHRFTGKIKNFPARQYVHRSGALFIRAIRDQQGWAILAGIENNRHANKENGFREMAKTLMQKVTSIVASLSKDGAE